MFGIEILTILLAFVSELFYIQLVTNVFQTVNSPALSDTLVTCSQVVRYLGIGKLAIWECWSGHGSRLLD